MTVKKRLFFSGIAGTGMGSVAGLFQALGYFVAGSDNAIYPPMSTMLEKLGIRVFSPYSEKNIDEFKPDLVIVGNALSRGHPEADYVMRKQIPFTSFPALLGEEILSKKETIVVSGTHGKTTTTALICHLLEGLGLNPSYLIGGVPKDKEHSFHVGDGPLFAIEGDEYDTAFFDKGPKFLHYRPKYLIVNNIEYDHADIYANIEEIYTQFIKLMRLVDEPKNIIANIDNPGVREVLTRMDYWDKVTSVATLGEQGAATFTFKRRLDTDADERWSGTIHHENHGSAALNLSIPGEHNLANAAMAYSLLMRLKEAGSLNISKEADHKLGDLFKSFAGVKRRIELVAKNSGIFIYEDFAHHPTAVAEGLKSLRFAHPQKRLLVAFEPKNATSRRNVFTHELAKSLGLADGIYIGACPLDLRIPEEQRMDTKVLGDLIGSKAKIFDDNQHLWNSLRLDIKKEDIIVFMSSSSFDGMQKNAAEYIQAL